MSQAEIAVALPKEPAAAAHPSSSSDTAIAGSSKVDRNRPGRTYHFPAEMASAGARSSGVGVLEWDLLSHGLGSVRQSTSTDRVDLDLSFDFVSQGGEGSSSRSLDSVASHRVTRTVPSAASHGQYSASVDSVSPARRRGMADAMSAPGSSRKRPPKPLSFLKKTANELQDASKSYFSPDTARPPQLSSDIDADGPLPVIPLSATRRGQASSLTRSGSISSSRRERSNSLVRSQPPSDPPATPLPPLPMSASSASSSGPSLVQEQRRQRAQEQLQSRKDRDSFVPLVPRSEHLSVASSSTSRPMSTDIRTPLDQTFTPQQPAAPKKLRKKASHGDRLANISKLLNKASSSRLAPPESALGLDTGLVSPTPQDHRTPRSLVKSPEVALTDLPSFGSQSLGLNIFGIDTEPHEQPIQPLSSASPRAAELTESESTPESGFLSTPETPSSSLFDGPGSVQGSEYSKATSQDSARPKSMRKGFASDLSLPRARQPTVTDVITEEPLEEKRQASMGLPRSETAEWIRQQHEEVQNARERQETASSSGSTSPTHPMILSTSSSIDTAGIANDDLTQTLEGKGPWPQSPLLLVNDNEGQTLDGGRSGEAGIGLGLYLRSDQAAAKLVQPSQAHTSMVVARQEAASPLMPSLPPHALLAKDLQADTPSSSGQADHRGQPSPTSSSEGFSVNATQPRTFSSFAASRMEQAKLRLSNRLFSNGAEPKQRPASDSPRSPTMRPLTLVARQEADDLCDRELRRHSLAIIGSNFRTSVASRQDEQNLRLNAAKDTEAPKSAPLPYSPTFPESVAVPTTFERSKRSAKHVRRTSRLQYIPDSGPGEVRVTISEAAPVQRQHSKRYSVIGAGAATEASQLAMLASFKSPRPAPSPSGNTPDMLYGHPRSNVGWGYVPRSPSTGTVQILDSPRLDNQEPQTATVDKATPSSPWLDFEDDGRGLRATRERFESLTQQPTGRIGAVPSAQDAADSSMSGEIDGLRRRSALAESNANGHQTANPLSPTATIQPFGWKSRFSGNTKRSSVHLDIVAGDNGAKIGEVTEEKLALRKLRLQGDLPEEEAEQETRPLSIFVPLAAIQSHLRQRNIEERQKRLQSLSSAPVASKPVTTERREVRQAPPKSMLAAGSHLLYSSGRILDTELTSKTMFFAGFLGMPWLWLIGGWWLANDGLMMTPGAQQVQFWTHEASMQQAQADDERDCRRSTLSGLQVATDAQKPGAERLSTIYSVDEGVSRDQELTRDHETMPTLYEATNSGGSGAFGSGTLHTAASGSLHTAASRQSSTSALPSPASFASRSSVVGGGRTLLAHSTDKVPRQGRKSMNSLLNPHPSVALFHSPVRSVPTSMSLDEDVRVSMMSADDSGVELQSSYGGGVEGRKDHRAVTMETPGEAEGRLAMTRPVRLSARERLAMTDKFVLMNRFMAVISTIAVFAGFGAALNAVAMNF